MLISINEAQMPFKELIEKIKSYSNVNYYDFIGRNDDDDLKGADDCVRKLYLNELERQIRYAKMHLECECLENNNVFNTILRLRDLEARLKNLSQLMEANSTQVTFPRNRPTTRYYEQPSCSKYSSS